VPFVSYPYEWCFSALKDAAMLTLAVHKRALKFGMALKDASAYNVQFPAGKPVFIDTLSFEAFREGAPWVAYRQFCRHFLAPLALMSLLDVRLNELCRTNLEGIPLDLASRLLPWRSRLRFSLLLHIHMHAGAERQFAPRSEAPRKGTFSKRSMLGLIENLESALRGLNWQAGGSEWSSYQQDRHYSEESATQKRALVDEFIGRIQPTTVWDLGANVGEFSQLASARGCQTIAFDADPACVELAYQSTRKQGETRILPLLMDLLNPSPAQGWCSRERMSLLERGPADAVLALALIHHLAIGGNLPLRSIAEFFQRMSRWLVIEFVPKTDPQAQRLLVVREDIFSDYEQDVFERVFRELFLIMRSEKIVGSDRTLYLMRRRETA
jgi:hypothetical protein